MNISDLILLILTGVVWWFDLDPLLSLSFKDGLYENFGNLISGVRRVLYEFYDYWCVDPNLGVDYISLYSALNGVLNDISLTCDSSATSLVLNWSYFWLNDWLLGWIQLLGWQQEINVQFIN